MSIPDTKDSYHTDYLNKIHNQECLAGLKLLPDECVHCIVTSPPYFGLRDYGVNGQIGTTALVARKFNRNFIGFELNPEYIKIAEKRLYKELGMFL